MRTRALKIHIRQCGVAGAGGKIVGGQETAPNKYPWMAAVLWVNEEGVLRQPAADQMVGRNGECVNDS